MSYQEHIFLGETVRGAAGYIYIVRVGKYSVIQKHPIWRRSSHFTWLLLQ